MYSGTSTTGADSSPAVPIGSVYSGTSWIAASTPFTPPVNSGRSTTGAASSPLLEVGASGLGSGVGSGSGVGVGVWSFNWSR